MEHTVTLNEGRSGAVRVDINKGLVDLQAVAISTPTYIFDGRNNTITATIANNGTTGSGRFNVSLAVDGVVVDRADLESLDIGCAADVTFNWRPPLTGTGNHTLTVTADSDGEIDESNETNNAASVDVFVGVPDFTVLDVIPDPEYCVIGDTIRINATVANLGVRGETAVVKFYDNGTFNLNIARAEKDWGEVNGTTGQSRANDTITLPGALAIRLHVKDINFTAIDIYDKIGSKISSLPDEADYWTDWIPGDTIRLEESAIGHTDPYGTFTTGTFTIDKYQALIANKTIHLTADEETIVPASYWNATAGSHDLFVTIDPHDTIPEYDETNNSLTALPICVDGIDLEVVDVDEPEVLLTDDIVDITAIITNNGAGDAGSFMVRFEDELVGGNVTIFNETLVPSLSAGSSINITVPWNLTGMDVSIGNCTHNITVSILFDISPRSRYWPKDDSNMENNILKLQNLDIIPRWDFAVENVTVTPSEAREGGVVDITAIIGNHGHVGGNVSVGFYIDMADNILGYDVVPLAYCDCLGAERGWSRDDVSNYTGRYIRIGTGTVWVDEGGTNTTSIRWDADIAFGCHMVMVVADPEERLGEGVNDTDVEESVFKNNMKNCSLSITPPDLSITKFSLPGYADVRDMVNMTAVIRNNDDMQANSTLWWVVGGNKSVIKECPGTRVGDYTDPDPEIQPQLGALMTRVHFSYIHLYYEPECSGHHWVAGVNVVANGQNLYSQSSDLISGELEEYDIWTKWGSGDTLSIESYGKEWGSAYCVIDKYQVVIGNEMITLDADESYDAIWNATVPPEAYTAWVDVEDQNKSGTIILNGTDLAVTDLSVRGNVFDGDDVSIDITITNLGKMDAGGFTVEIYDHWTDWGSYKEPVAVNSFSGLKAGGSVSDSVPWTASLKNGSHASHNHNISVEATPKYTLPEINGDNNVRETEVHINESRDFSVTNLTFAVDNRTCGPSELVLGENVTMTAAVDVTNHANCGGTLDVGFYFTDEHYGYYNSNPPENRLIGGTTIPVSFDPGNGIEYATLNWRIDNFDDVEVPGHHHITVVADPNDKVLELEDRDNKFCQPIYVRSPDLVVEEITFDTESYAVGDLVNITARVGNLGDKNESSVTVAYIISREDERIESPHDYPNDWNDTYAIHAPGVQKMRIHFEEINIRQWYTLNPYGVYCDHIYVYDVNANEIEDYTQGHRAAFSITTDWIEGDIVTVKLVSFSGSENPDDYYEKKGTNWGFLINRIDMKFEDRTSLDIGEHKSLPVTWNVSRAGSYRVNVTIDPENKIPEHNEENNTRIERMLVQGADLTVSNLTLTVNGSDVTRTIKHGDLANITAEIANVGVRDAHNISVGFFIGVDQINKTNIDLSKGGSINISAHWNTTPRDYIGNHTIRVFVDCDYAISETNESNNTLTEDVYVCTPELSGNLSWQPENPLDEDIVTINATITNVGRVAAEDFTVLMFYDYPGGEVYSKTHYRSADRSPPDEHRSYDGAEWVYVRITGTSNIDQGDLIVYDRDNTIIASPVEPCWIAVPGDAVKVTGTCSYWEKCVTVRFYAVYPGNLLEVERLDAGSALNFSMVQKVSSFNRTITVFIDPENNVSENDETDNAPSESMYVTPTRDFTVTNVTAAETANLTDTDTIRITATVANIGFRNGTANVSFVDREKESHTYNYAFSKTISPPYAPVSPQADRIIHRPDVDAIEVDLTYNIPVKTFGQISVCDGTGKTVWYVTGSEYVVKSGSVIVYIEGDTALIYGSDFLSSLHGHTIYEFNRTEIVLNATDTWNESGTLTSIWTASTGDHIITVVADPDDETGEIDESNNNESILIHVNPSRDPAIINLTHTPLHPMDGNDVTITAEVRNNGDKTANFTVDFWENTSSRYETDSSHVHIPGASFVDIHLDYRWNRTMIPVGFEWTRINDTWLGGSLGDTIEVRSPRYGELYVCGVQMFSGPAGAYVWREHVNRIRYMKLLNRTHVVTLEPNETRNVTAIWKVMCIRDDPEYSVIVIVDPEDEIDEINESNNEMECEIVMNYPDFEIGNFESPTERSDARVTIKNTGIGGADDVDVTFEMARREDYSLTGTRGYYTVRHGDDNPEHIRVHFDYINIPDSGGNLKIAKSIRSLRRGDVAETYRGDVEAVWCPWVEGDKLLINSFNARSFKVDGYEWGDVEEETIDLDEVRSNGLDMMTEEWEWEYTEPMNLTVRVDPDDEIPEMDEENNNETVIVYADLRADRIEFVSPTDDKLCLDAEKFVIDGYITNGGGYKDDIVYPVSDFNVTLKFRERYPNGTLGEVVFNTTKHVDEPFYAGQDMIRFEFDPDEELEVGGNYSVYLIADSSGDICESNDVYPKEKDIYRLGESKSNNITLENVYVYNSSGYTGGGELINIAQGEVNGRVVYMIGDSGYPCLVHGGKATVRYADTTPDGADDIEFARLFVYWTTCHKDSSGDHIPELADVDVTFNGHSPNKVGNYSDSGTTTYEYGYGLYSYEVADYIVRGENEATVTNNADWIMYVSAIGLLVVYEDEDEPLTKYWINEGADVMMADNMAGEGDYATGLIDCITTAPFDGVDREDTENVNATLLTVLGMYSPYDRSYLYSDKGDMLEFNYQSIGSLIGTGHWKDHYNKSGIALTSPEWVDVTDHLKRGNNLAEIHSTGNCMLANNAFLRLIFPPDLNVINLTAPASTVVGAHHSINATIRNDGRSDAHDFNVTFHIDGKQMVRIPHLDLPAGENMTIHLYNWTPMMLMHVYNLTAAADVLSGEDWTEIETDNNAMTKQVPIEEGGFGNQTGPRGIGGGSNPTGGEYTEPITGKVMRGIKEFLAGGGGGGAGMFSLTEWIMKGAVWLMLLLFVGLGYRMEQRSYGRASAGYGGGL